MDIVLGIFGCLLLLALFTARYYYVVKSREAAEIAEVEEAYQQNLRELEKVAVQAREPKRGKYAAPYGVQAAPKVKSSPQVAFPRHRTDYVDNTDDLVAASVLAVTLSTPEPVYRERVYEEPERKTYCEPESSRYETSFSSDSCSSSSSSSDSSSSTSWD